MTSQFLEEEPGILFFVVIFQIIYDLIVSVLSENTLTFLDTVFHDVYQSAMIKNFPYKSISETLNLVLLSMLRQLVKDTPGTSKISTWKALEF